MKKCDYCNKERHKLKDIEITFKIDSGVSVWTKYKRFCSIRCLHHWTQDILDLSQFIEDSEKGEENED